MVSEMGMLRQQPDAWACIISPGEENSVSSSAVSLPKHPHSRSSVSGAGVLAIISGAASLLFGIVTLFGLSTEPRTLTLAVAGLMILAGGLGIATGWGLLKRSRWAQVLAIICAIELVSPNALPADVSGWVGELISVAIGVWWLRLFVGKLADDEFTNAESPTVPGAVLAVSWLLISDLLSVPLEWKLRTPTFLYGHIFAPPYSIIISATICVVSFVVGAALLKRSRLGFWLAIGLQVFGSTNAVVTNFTPKAMAELNRIVASVVERWHITGSSGIGRTFSFLEPIVIGLCLIFSWQGFKTASEAIEK